MSDSRIAQYREAVLALREHRFPVSLEPKGHDEVAQLGEALRVLGEDLEQRSREASALLAAIEKVNSGILIEEVMEQIYDSLRPFLPYDRIGLALLNEEGTEAYARWSRSESTNIQIDEGYSAPLAGSSLQRLLETGQPRVINDLEAYLAEHPRSESTRRIVAEGMRSSLTCPLVAMGRQVGFLFFSSCQKNTYRDAHVDLYLEIAGVLATTLEKSRLYQQVTELSEERSKLLGIAAHDLRSPLSVISGYVDLLLRGRLGELNDRQREVLQTVADASQGMISLLNNTLDSYAIQSGRLQLKLQSVSVDDFIRESYQANNPLAALKSIRLELHLPEPLGTATFDRDRIGQAISNLVANAVKYSAPESTVVLAAYGTDDAITFEVSDHGQGIAEEDRARLFTEYGRTDAKPTGSEPSSGLGLAIARRMVEAHGGRIWVESRVGSGSTFRFRLPRQQSTP